MTVFNVKGNSYRILTRIAYADQTVLILAVMMLLDEPTTGLHPIGTREIRFLLAESGTSQSELSEILGVKQPAASMLMSGKRGLTLDAVQRLLAYFKVSADYFI